VTSIETYELECPFCGKLTLIAVKSYTTSEYCYGGRTRSHILRRTIDVLLSEKCSNCGKSEKEIKREFKRRFDIKFR
jgi:hypothetical protein